MAAKVRIGRTVAIGSEMRGDLLNPARPELGY